MIRPVQFLLITLVSIFSTSSFSQDNVGIGTTAPSPNAVLDIQTNDKGLLIPRLSTAQRTGILQPALGAGDRSMLVYDTNDDLFYYWDGIQWIPFPLDNDPLNELQDFNFANDTLSLSDGNFVTLDDLDKQQINISNDTIFLQRGGFVVLPGYVDTDNQNLSLNRDTLFIQDGNFVILSDIDSVNEFQNLIVLNDSLHITDGSGVALEDLVNITIAGDTFIINNFPIVFPFDADTQQLSIRNDTLFLQNGGFAVLPTDNDQQQLSQNGDTLFLQNGGFVILTDNVIDADADSTNEIQSLSQNGDTIFLSSGGFVLLSDQVDDADADSTNEIQVLTQNGDTVFLSDGGFVVLQDSVGVDTDDQQISISNDTIFLQDGGFAILPPGAVDTDDQQLSLSNDTLFLQDGGFVILTDNVIDDDADSTNEIQSLSQNGDTIFLSNGGFVLLSDQVDDADADSTNELQVLTQNGDTVFLSDGGFVVLQDSVGVDTDDQFLTLNGDTLFIDGGNFVLLTDNVDDADNDSTNELQNLNVANDSLYISGGNGVSVNQIVNVNQNGDTIFINNFPVVIPPGSDSQQLTISNDTVYLSSGGFVVLPPGAIDTDDQTLSINGDTLFIADGNFVVLMDQVDDADSDSTNEIQFLSQNGDTIFLTNGGFVVIPSSQDHDWYEAVTGSSPTNINQSVYTLGEASVGLNSSGFARLDIMGNNIADHSLQLRAGDVWNDTSSAQILFGYNGSANYRHSIRTRHQSGGRDGNAIDFYLWDFTDAAADIGSKRVMTIDARHDGMVGVGTATPRSELHISDGSASLKAVTDAGAYGASMLITDNINPRIYFEEANSAVNRKLMDIRSEAGILRVSALNDVGSAYTLQNIFTIDRDGFVGVMTANPVEELHVTGSIRMVDGTQANGYIMTSDVNGTGSWQDPALLFPGSNNNWLLTGNAGTSSGTNFLGTTDLNSLVLRTNNIERMRVDSIGQVGINQPNPQHTLHVVGDVRFEGNFVNQEILGTHSGTIQSIPFTNGVFNSLTGTTVSVTIEDGNGPNNSAVFISGFARVFGGNLDGSPSSLGGYFLILQRDTDPAFSAPVNLTYTSGTCYIETPDGLVSASIGYGGGGHVSYIDDALVAGTTYYYRLSLYPNGIGISSGTYDVYERDLNLIQVKR